MRARLLPYWLAGQPGAGLTLADAAQRSGGRLPARLRPHRRRPAGCCSTAGRAERADYRDVVPLLAADAEVVVPDLRGFGESDRHDRPPAEAYSAAAQAASVLALIEELGLDRAGARRLRRRQPDRAGDRRRRGPDASGRWSSPRRCRASASGSSPPPPSASSGTSPSTSSPLAEQLLDGRRTRSATTWPLLGALVARPASLPDPDRPRRSSSRCTRDPARSRLDRLVPLRRGRRRDGAEERAPAPEDRIARPTTVLWGEHEPLYPPAWSDRSDEYYADFAARPLDGVGHFTPLEAPQRVATATVQGLRR